MNLRILNTGSSGNCYILENASTALIVECGVPFKEIKQALNFDLGKVAGCIVTHEHQDHCKGLREMLAAGIEVYASAGTINASGLKSHRLHSVEALKEFKLSAWTILPFDVKHDCVQPFGFVISHPDCGKVLFITDSYYCSYTFSGLNNILIEANYGREILSERFRAGTIHSFVKDRVLQSHMSLETCVGLLSANDLSAVHNIVLIHLSDSNSDAAIFKQQVQQLTGKAVHVAEKNMSIPFLRTPF